jgi:hypothetical protein
MTLMFSILKDKKSLTPCAHPLKGLLFFQVKKTNHLTAVNVCVFIFENLVKLTLRISAYIQKNLNRLSPKTKVPSGAVPKKLRQKKSLLSLLATISGSGCVTGTVTTTTVM